MWCPHEERTSAGRVQKCDDDDGRHLKKRWHPTEQSVRSADTAFLAANAYVGPAHGVGTAASGDVLDINGKFPRLHDEVDGAHCLDRDVCTDNLCLHESATARV